MNPIVTAIRRELEQDPELLTEDKQNLIKLFARVNKADEGIIKRTFKGNSSERRSAFNSVVAQVIADKQKPLLDMLTEAQTLGMQLMEELVEDCHNYQPTGFRDARELNKALDQFSKVRDDDHLEHVVTKVVEALEKRDALNPEVKELFLNLYPEIPDDVE